MSSTKIEKLGDVVQVVESVMIDESMDAGVSQKRRKTTRRHRVRNKKEVMGDKSVDKVSTDVQDK